MIKKNNKLSTIEFKILLVSLLFIVACFTFVVLFATDWILFLQFHAIIGFVLMATLLVGGAPNVVAYILMILGVAGALSTLAFAGYLLLLMYAFSK